MNFICHFENATEERQHLQAIHALAQDLNQDEDMVRSLYEQKLGHLQQEAKIKAYLAILARRQVIDSLRSRGLIANR